MLKTGLRAAHCRRVAAAVAAAAARCDRHSLVARDVRRTRPAARKARRPTSMRRRRSIASFRSTRAATRKPSSAAIFAFRSRSQPAIVQVNEIATATMMAAKGAIYPVHDLMRDESEPFLPAAYLPAVTGYYTDLAGNMLSFPFNASTPILYYNKELFRKAGLDPEVAPKTWPEVGAAAQRLRVSGVACGFTTHWPSWVNVENFSARARCADRHEIQRLRRARHVADDQQSAGRAPHRAACGVAEDQGVSTTAAARPPPSRASRTASAGFSSARRRRAPTS